MRYVVIYYPESAALNCIESQTMSLKFYLILCIFFTKHVNTDHVCIIHCKIKSKHQNTLLNDYKLSMLESL